MPPIKVMMQAVEAQPATGSPNMILRTMMKMIARNDTIVIRTPNQEAISSGTCEKLTMPSIAYPTSFQKFHLV